MCFSSTSKHFEVQQQNLRYLATVSQKSILPQLHFYKICISLFIYFIFIFTFRLRKKENKIPGRFGSHRSHQGSFVSNSFRDSSRHGSMKERALMTSTKTSRNSSLSRKSNGHAHRHQKCSCNCGDSPLLKKHSPRNSRQSLGDHSSCAGTSPYCNHTKRYLYHQASLMRDSMDSDYYADDDATHSGATSDNNITCTCGAYHGSHPERTSKHSLPDTTVVTIEHNNNTQRPQMSPEKSRRYQSKARGVKLQAMKRLQLSQPYSYDMCMCELPSTSNTQTMCMCSASHGSLSGTQKRGFSASAPNLADLERKETQT